MFNKLTYEAETTKKKHLYNIGSTAVVSQILGSIQGSGNHLDTLDSNSHFSAHQKIHPTELVESGTYAIKVLTLSNKLEHWSRKEATALAYNRR
jgi:hypothetical protein